jgi:hypothetical protein
MLLLPSCLESLAKVAKEIGLSLKGSTINLDSGFDSKRNRMRIFRHGMIPNIKENKRGRVHKKRGRPRLFNAEIYKNRFKVERSYAWEDKFRRLIIRYEYKHIRHTGMRLIAGTLLNIRSLVSYR